jgi:multidrug efflux pump
MYLLNYSLDNLSLMAITIATGFVVDDAIVVLENVTRHLEQGMRPLPAALLGAREIGFTVLSMSTSLIAVFIPILLMSGYVGRLFREFAVTLSVAIAVSMLVSLTTTPMMCATILKPAHDRHHGRLFMASEWVFQSILKFYGYTLARVLEHPVITLLVTFATIGLSTWLYIAVPKGFFPQQDTGRLGGTIIADQKASFQSMSQLLQLYSPVVSQDHAVNSVIAFSGGAFGSGVNTASMQVDLKPIDQRPNHESIDVVMARLRRELAGIPGASLIFKAQQDINIGGRNSTALYQFTAQGDDLTELNQWAPNVLDAVKKLKSVTDVTSDQQNRGLAAKLVVDRNTAGRLGVVNQNFDDILYDAFGQRQVSTMFETLNQYHVVMEVAHNYNQDPDEALKSVYYRSSTGGLVPMSSFAHYSPDTTSRNVAHQGQYPDVTISFNLPPGVPLGVAVDQITNTMNDIRLPADIHTSFQGTAKAFQEALSNQLVLIITAILTVYIVLGVLYESYIHPITILSTLPSAGVGALLALEIFHIDLTVIATIGIILLIGIVKKNAIMMVDFAIETERTQKISPKEAIYQACMLRFRPIMMTTMAALLGSVPLAMGNGTGSELRRPLGITIIGGLIFSQALTLYTTPVVYLWLDRLRLFLSRVFIRAKGDKSAFPMHPIPETTI